MYHYKKKKKPLLITDMYHWRDMAQFERYSNVGEKVHLRVEEIW